MGQTMLGTIHPLLLNHSTLANHLPTHPPSPVPPSSSPSPPFLSPGTPFLSLSLSSGIRANLTDLINIILTTDAVLPYDLNERSVRRYARKSYEDQTPLSRIARDGVPSTLVALHSLRTRANPLAGNNLFAFIRNDDNVDNTS